MLTSLTHSSRTLKRGIEYYKLGKVKEVEKQYDKVTGTTEVTAVVMGSGGKRYYISLTVDARDHLVSGACTCPAFAETDGACKHMVATALYVDSHAFRETPPHAFDVATASAASEMASAAAAASAAASEMASEAAAKVRHLRAIKALRNAGVSQSAQTDLVASLLIEAYAKKNRKAIEKNGEQLGTIHVIPKLVLECEKVSLELSVGADRQYVVRSLGEFCAHLENEEEVSYGKQLSFLHCKEAFHPDSAELVSFVSEQYRQVKSLGENAFAYSYSYYSPLDMLFSKGKRGMLLSPKALDQFFELYMDQWVQLREKNYAQESQDKRYNVRNASPKISVEVVRQEGGLQFLTSDFGFLKGKERLYLWFKEKSSDCIWCCDETYKNAMGDFLSCVQRGEGSYFIAQKDISAFCVDVLTQIRDYVSVLDETQALEAFMPEEMTAQVFLDAPTPGLITAKVMANYQGTAVNMYERFDKSPVVRNENEEYRIRTAMERYFHAYDKKHQFLFMEGDNDCIYDFLSKGASQLATVAEILATDRYKRLLTPAKPKMSVGVCLDSDLLDVTFDLEGFPPEELLDALSHYKAKKRYHRLRDGTFLTLEDEDLQDILQFTEGMGLSKKDLAAGKIKLPKYRAMYLDSMMKSAEKMKFDRDSRFKGLIRSIKSVEDSDLEAPKSLQPILRDYQKTGYCWLSTMSQLGFGGILADDMGLGKTLEVISLLLAEAQGEQELPAAQLLGLVVCPASLILNWEKELQKFAPSLLPHLIMGTAGERKKQLEALFDRQREGTGGSVIALTSYDLLKRDLPLYDGLFFRYHIIDEAQYIKNFSTQNAKAVKGIESLQRFALTGTPMENRLSELWSIFDFLMPGYLYTYNAFREQYETPILKEQDEERLTLLKKQITPFILRRLKKNVLRELPDKVETVVYAKMETEQRKIYMANLAKIKLEVGKEITQGAFETNKLQILAMLTRLRQLCCHPSLCYEDYHQGSGKLETCMELILEAVGSDHRILLFSQFTSMLAMLEERLKAENIPYYILTGQTPKTRRMEMVEAFNENTIPIFLISLKAGGTGLNLTGADTVIHYDPWWNLAAQNQATDRVHRIGQEHSVQVYKLICEDSIEEKILKLQESKQELADSVITENAALLTALSSEQIWELL